MHTYIYIYIHMYTHIIYVCIHIHVHTKYLRQHTSPAIYSSFLILDVYIVWMYIYVHIYAHIYVCIYMYMYIYTTYLRRHASPAMYISLLILVPAALKSWKHVSSNRFWSPYTPRSCHIEHVDMGWLRLAGSVKI